MSNPPALTAASWARRAASLRPPPSVSARGTRAFVKGADGSIYVLLYNGIGKVDTKAHTVSRVVSSPVRITVGGAAANGRIYFGSNNHLYSWKAQ